MPEGLLHGHKGLAYLICLLALVSFALALTAARKNRSAAAALSNIGRFGVLMPGRINLVLGLGLWMMRGWPPLTPWLIGSLLLWGPVEVVWSRFVAPELARVRAGGQGSGRMIVGTLLQLLAIVAIFALMMVKPA